jgi:hypothetical protein
MGQSLVKGLLPKCLNRFIVSEVNSESEQARGPNPKSEQQHEHLSPFFYYCYNLKIKSSRLVDLFFNRKVKVKVQLSLCF